MIDGITIKDTIANFETWKSFVKINFGTTSDLDTGEVLTKKREGLIVTTHRAKWETFNLTVKEVMYIDTGKKMFYLTIDGSLHKNHYGGKNYLPFKWQQLQQQIEHITTSLLINPNTAQISMLEVGVNIVTPFIVTPFLMQNLVDYKGNRFNQYPPDKNGFCLGNYCTLTQYQIKIYDKGLQNQMPQNLMRFEKRFLRMQQLNAVGIKYLADLENKVKVKNLLPMLLAAWQNVLVYDIKDLQHVAKFCNIKTGEFDLLTKGQHSKFWEKLKKDNIRKYNYQRDNFKKLVSKNGNNWQQKVSSLIGDEWQQLIENCTKLQSGEKAKLYNLTIKINGNNVQNRICESCGNDISNQKESSKFCSAKVVGYEAAHRCRNIANNGRNNFNNKIKRITSMGLLFDVMPYFVVRL